MLTRRHFLPLAGSALLVPRAFARRGRGSVAASTGDWVARSTAAGVFFAAPLNSASEASGYYFTGPEAVSPALDTSITPFGQPGSIRFTRSNSDSTQSGTLKIPLGTTIGPGQTLWLSFRQYMPPEWAYMLHPTTSGGTPEGIKQAIISGINNSHENFEVVWESNFNAGFVSGYHADLSQSGGYATWETLFNGSDFKYQPTIENDGSGVVSPDSVYSDVNGGTDPDTGSLFSTAQKTIADYGGTYASQSDAAFGWGLGHPLAGAVRYPINQFATYTACVNVGSWGAHNSRIRHWVAPEGQPYIKLFDSSTEELDSDVDAGFNCLWLLAYYSNAISGGLSVQSRSNDALAAATAIRAIGNSTAIGSGTLSYIAATKRFTWAESGGSAGSPQGAASWKRFINPRTSGGDGGYSSGKYLGIEITNYASLPVTDQTDTITIQSGRGTQTTQYAEAIASTSAINATAYNSSGVQVGPTGGYVPT